MSDKPKTIADYALQGGKAHYATDWPAAMREDARRAREKAVAEYVLKAAENRYVTGTNDPLTVTGRLRWGPDSFGKPEYALFIGRICAGTLMHFDRDGRPNPYRAWIMKDNDDGDELGWFPSEAEARAALVQAVKEAIGG